MPIAQTDYFFLNQSGWEIIDVLVNDTGVGDKVQIFIISQAVNGVVSVRDDGLVSYVPNMSYFGKDEFLYEIIDQDGDSSIASVILDIECTSDCTSKFILTWEASKSEDIVGYNVYMGRGPDELSAVFELGKGVSLPMSQIKKVNIILLFQR